MKRIPIVRLFLLSIFCISGTLQANVSRIIDAAFKTGVDNMAVVWIPDYGLWPCNASSTAPDAPTIGLATAGNSQATIAFTAPLNNGGVTIIDYTATSNPGGKTATLTQAGSGTITVTGLTNGTTYTFTVKARNVVGNSIASAASNAVKPDVSTSLSNVELQNTAIILTTAGIVVPLTGMSYIELFNASGVLIQKTCIYGNYARSLVNGIYIIRVNGIATKFVK
ncbi:MAG: fibronectin type III domain-containing protein [Paludibacter sp.]